MPIATMTILTWCRITLNRRATVTNEILPGGLEDLNDYTIEDIKDSVKGFQRLAVPGDRFNITTFATKRLVQLTLWVKDRVRLQQAVEFANGTTLEQFVDMIEEAQQRDKIRQQRKKNAEALATMKLDPPLKGSPGWDAWMIAVKSSLSMAYGSKGVPLSYIIREEDAPHFDGATWEELSANATPHVGLDYEADRKTVHLFIVNNLAEDSDAYAT